MEFFLIVLMLILVFKTKLASAFQQHLPVVSKNIEPLIKYLGASAILSATIAAFPTLCIIVYMRTEGFFAYELFTSESHAFEVLAGNIFVNFLMLSFGFFGAAVFFAAKVGKWVIGCVALLNALLVSYFLFLAYITNKFLLVGCVLLVVALIAGYLYFWLSSGVTGKARGWFMPILFAALLLIFPIWLPSFAVELTASSLAQMKVGGMWVELSEPAQFFEPKANRKVIKQWLVLRTPDTLYLKENKESMNVTVFKADAFTVTPSK